MFKNKILSTFYVAAICLLTITNTYAQEYTVSGQGSTNPLDVQTRGLNELIEKVDEEIKDVTNCGGSQQFFTGSGCEYLNESEPQTNSAAKSPMISCSAANELAKWNGTNWYCESITVPNDCAGNAQLSECSTSSLSLQNGQTQTGVTCEGTYGQCSADVTCNSGSYSISNEYCPPIPVNCYDSVGGAGCTTMRSLSHGQAGNWSCDTGYTGDCSAVCNAGNFQAVSNQCSGAGTWTPGAWGTCSNTCGTGTQTRTYTCVGGVCTTPQPADDSQSCTNYSTCNFTWQSGSWGTCSVTCGGGTQTRTVVCKRSDGTTVSDSNCSGTKPASSQTCNTTACATYSWQTGSWGTCSVTCGGGTQTRTVVCKRNDGVTVADGNCSGAKPANSQTCNTTACATYSWQTGSWGTCSVTCGGGTQTRTVSCKRNDGVTVSSTYCSGTKPAASQTCNTQSCNASCTIRHPIGWYGAGRLNPPHCIEYYLRPGGTIGTSTLAHGSSAMRSARYCANGQCWGTIRYECDNGSMRITSKTCNYGLQP